MATMTAPLIPSGTARLLIDGEWVAGDDGEYVITNPATEEPVGWAPEASVAQADAAAAAAAAAFPAWAATAPEERARLLQAAADRIRERTGELVPLVQAETGATLMTTKMMQVPFAANRFERYARHALDTTVEPLPPVATPGSKAGPGTLSGGLAQRLPVGVVVCITSYNFPIVNMAGKVGPALAMGNCVILKPAPQDPLAVIEVAKICHEVGFPPGVVQVITSSQAAPAAALTSSPHVDMVSFTGSTAVGQQIYATGAQTMKRLLLELGGKSANLVFDDADFDRALRGAASPWTFHSGQICIAPTRLFVQRGIHDRFVEALAAFGARLPVGDPLERSTVVGPVITDAHRARIEGYVDAGRAEGAEVLCGGTRPGDLERGWFVAPTLIANATNEMTPAREEIFGPVVTAIPFDDEDEAVALANDSDFGLHGYVWSGDGERALRVAGRMRTGSVAINGGAQQHPEAPFGGFKLSGIGRDGGRYGMLAYSEYQAVTWL